MKPVSAAEIRQSAQKQMELSSLLEKAKPLVDELYPGMVIIISPSFPESPATQVYSDSFRIGGTAIQQIERVLREYGEPMSKDQIRIRLRSNGSTMIESTLTSTLSKTDKFCNPDRGMWALSEWKNISEATNPVERPEGSVTANAA